MSEKANEYLTKASEVYAQVNLLLGWKDNILDGLANGGGGYSFDDVLERVVNGTFKLIDLGDAYFIIQLAQYPQFKSYHVFLAGGNMETLIAAVPDLRQEAKALGCQKLALNGRMGWWKIYKDRLPVKPYLTLTMEVDDG